MNQESQLTRGLANAQEEHARRATFERGRYHYRLYTEQFANLRRLAASHLGGFTISEDLAGVWAGAFEQSAIIDYIGSETDVLAIRALASDIKRINSQQVVLVESWPVNLEAV